MRATRYSFPIAALGLCLLAPAPAHGQCPADVTNDGVVDTADLVELVLAWGPCSSPCPPDLDGNGAVDTVDLVEMLVAWGVCAGDAQCMPDTILTIEASSDLGSASMSIPLAEGEWVSDIFYVWCLSTGCEGLFPPDDPYELTDTATGEVIGTVLFARVKVVLGSRLDVEAKVIAGESDTTFVFSTGTVAMDTIDVSAAEGRSTVTCAVSDQNCDGWAEVIGLGEYGGGILRSTYNGGTGLFSELLGGVTVDGSCWPFLLSGGSADPQSGYREVGDSVSDIATELAFEVTSGDWAQATGKFWIAPEPGTCDE